MTSINDLAFPCIDDDASIYRSGLTKLEYFAAMAMQGMLASYSNTTDPDDDYVAERSIGYAKALINELNKTENE